MVFLARRALQERFTSKGREAAAGQGIEVGSWVCVLNGRHFPAFSAGDKGEVVRVDQEALNCDVLFDGTEQPVPVALRHLKLLCESHSENASAKMVAALRSPGGMDDAEAPGAPKWRTREEVAAAMDGRTFADVEEEQDDLVMGMELQDGIYNVEGYEVNGYTAETVIRPFYETISADNCNDGLYGCGNGYKQLDEFASDASIVITRAMTQVNDQEIIGSSISLHSTEVKLGDDVTESSPTVRQTSEGSSCKTEPDDFPKPQALITGPASTKEERAAKLADMLAAMKMPGTKAVSAAATNGCAHSTTPSQHDSASASAACSSRGGSLGVPEFGSIDGTIFTFADSLDRAPLLPDGATSVAGSDTGTVLGEEQARALVAEERYDKVEALESRLALLEERHRQEVASLRNALELALAFGREQEARAASLEQRLAAPAAPSVVPVALPLSTAVAPAVAASPSTSVSAFPAIVASPRSSPSAGLAASPLASMAPPAPLTLPAVPVTPPALEIAEATLAPTVSAAAELPSVTAALGTASGTTAVGNGGGSNLTPPARLFPGPPLAASLPDGIARTLLLSDFASAPKGSSAAAPAGSFGSFSSDPLNSARSSEGCTGPPRRSCSLTAPSTAAAPGAVSGSSVAGGCSGGPLSLSSAAAELRGRLSLPVASSACSQPRRPTWASSGASSAVAPASTGTSMEVPVGGQVLSPRASASSGANATVPPVRRMATSPSTSGLLGQHGSTTPVRARPVAVEVVAAGPSITTTPSSSTGTVRNRRALSASAPCSRQQPHGGAQTSSPRQLFLSAKPTTTPGNGSAALNGSFVDLIGSTARVRQSSQGLSGIGSSSNTPVRGSSLTAPVFAAHLAERRAVELVAAPQPEGDMQGNGDLAEVLDRQPLATPAQPSDPLPAGPTHNSEEPRTPGRGRVAQMWQAGAGAEWRGTESLSGSDWRSSDWRGGTSGMSLPSAPLGSLHATGSAASQIGTACSMPVGIGLPAMPVMATPELLLPAPS